MRITLREVSNSSFLRLNKEFVKLSLLPNSVLEEQRKLMLSLKKASFSCFRVKEHRTKMGSKIGWNV